MKFKAKYSLALLAVMLSVQLPVQVVPASSLEYMDKECAQESKRENIKCVYHRASRLAFGGYQDKNKLKKAEEMLKRVLAMDPWHASAPFNLMQIYIQLKECDKALQVLNCTIKQRTWFVGARFSRCLLIEDLGCTREEAKACYRDVAFRYKRIGVNDVNYVIAELMAENPNAGVIKQEYFKQVKPGNTQEYMWNNSIKDFDRAKYVKDMSQVDPRHKKNFNLQRADQAECPAFMVVPREGNEEKKEYEATAQRKKREYLLRVKQRKLLVIALGFTREKDYQNALIYLDRHWDLGVRVSRGASLRCAVMEKAGRPEDEYKACYRRVLKAYEAVEWTHNDDYIRIGILAYWPDKEAIKEKVLTNFMPGTKAQENWSKYVDFVRRKDVLRDVMP